MVLIGGAKWGEMTFFFERDAREGLRAATELSRCATFSLSAFTLRPYSLRVS